MRPIKLVMSAFGPYAKEEVIDFSLLNNKNIFLITGPTGAGKTTIFDAISYALFGEASGSTRENETLRSDFADKNRLTYVELDFELRGENYHIKRIPQQMKPKVKGDGFTHQGSEAELILPSDKVISGTSNVTNKINELLGINKEQFKQIVMLPQGEFKKLLLADSKEREVIFRKIFGTYNYERIQALLNDKARDLKKDLEKSRDRILVNLKNIKSEEKIIDNDNIDFVSVASKIEELINTKKNEAKKIDDELAKIKKEIEKLQEEKIQSINNNKLLDDKKKVAELIEKYKSKELEIKEKEDILSKTMKAKEILFVEEEMLKQQKNKEVKEKINLEVEKNIDFLEKELEKAKSNLEVEESKEAEKDKLVEEANSLSDKKPKILEFDSKKKSIEELEIRIKEVKTASLNEQSSLERFKEEQGKIEEKQRDIVEFEKKKILIEREISEKKVLIDKVRELYRKLRDYTVSKNNHDKLKNLFIKQEKTYKDSKIIFEEKQEIYMKEQAGILADSLEIGMPCPVCGSLEHPSPAVRVSDVPSEEELKKYQEQFEEHQKEYNELLLKITQVKTNMDSLMNDVIQKRISELKERLGNDTYNEETEGKVLELGKGLGNEINELNYKLESYKKEISEKDSASKKLEEIKKNIVNSENKIKELNELYTNDYATLVSDKEKIKSLEKEIPKDIKSIEELEEKISVIKENIDLFNKKIKLAREKVNELNNNLSSEKAKSEEGKKQIKELDEEINKSKETVKNKILENKFKNYDEYNDVKQYIKSIDEIQHEISDFKQNFKSLLDRNDELKLKTKDLEYTDIDNIDLRINEKKKYEYEINEKSKELYSIITNNINILSEVREIHSKVLEKEKKYRVVGELANLANGKNSPYISFERFVLASYFQEIIDAANLRLTKMTGERFILKRKEDKGKGKVQQGLELEVYDNYTGKCRHVKTLSGGESFKASLSLALGLSDVVQANAGGISLDTIFIDEGFGTLDSESLDNAINSLIELQKGGRLVGIISHVPELKERIEAKLEIKATLEGSSAKFNFD